MRPYRRSMHSFIMTALVFRMLTRLALAYLEPGSTSFLLKIIISGLAGFVLASRYIWKTLRTLHAKLTSRQPQEEAPDYEEG